MTRSLARVGRVSLLFEPRDLWLGAYVGEDHVYFVIVPMLVFRVTRLHHWRATAHYRSIYGDEP